MDLTTKELWLLPIEPKFLYHFSTAGTDHIISLGDEVLPRA